MRGASLYFVVLCSPLFSCCPLVPCLFLLAFIYFPSRAPPSLLFARLIRLLCCSLLSLLSYPLPSSTHHFSRLLVLLSSAVLWYPLVSVIWNLCPFGLFFL